jgi:hypothetical protein
VLGLRDATSGVVLPPPFNCRRGQRGYKHIYLQIDSNMIKATCTCVSRASSRLGGGDRQELDRKREEHSDEVVLLQSIVLQFMVYV